MATTPKLSVIVPAFNEGEFIDRNVKIIEETLANAKIDYELIVVDDGSSDGTYEKAKALESERVKVYRKEKNGGKGSAVLFGFGLSQGDLIAFLDADLDLSPKHLPLYIALMKRTNADVVVGSKRHPHSKINYPLKRRFLSNCYFLLVKSLFGLHVKDTQAGVKLFKRQVLEKVAPKVLCKKYAFDLELLVVANSKGFKIIEAPVELNWKRFESRIKLKDIYRIFVDTLAVFYRLNIVKHYDGD